MEKKILSIDCDWIQNPNQMLELNDFVFKIFKNVKKIVFIKNHQTIVKYINTPSYICNVDNHHDINYGYKNEFINAGNWVTYLNQIGLLQSYTWIHNTTSEYIIDDVINTIRNLREFDFDINLNYINNIEFEEIFICESLGFYEKIISKEGRFFTPYNVFKQVALNFFKEKVIIDNEKNKSTFYNKRLGEVKKDS
jgi:hypothetical protein